MERALILDCKINGCNNSERGEIGDANTLEWDLF